MPLDLPDFDLVNIAEILKLSDSDFKKIYSSLKALDAYTDLTTIGKSLSKQINFSSSATIDDFIKTISTLYRIRDFAGVHSETFLEDVILNFLDSREPHDEAASDESFDKLEKRLSLLLNISVFITATKAARLQQDGERLYCTSKILTDIRPIFEENPAKKPLAAVVTHTLKLKYHHEHSHEEIHLILDYDDLNLLSNVIERAKQKDKNLKSLLKKIDLKDMSS